MVKTTISLIKADIGSFPGHSRIHPVLLEKAQKMLSEAEGIVITDSFVTHCGDDLELIMAHKKGVDSPEIHRLAWNVFMECAKTREGDEALWRRAGPPLGRLLGEREGDGTGSRGDGVRGAGVRSPPLLHGR